MNSDWFPQRTIYLLFWVVTVSQFILGFLLYGTTGTRQGLPNPDKLLKTNQFQHVLSPNVHCVQASIHTLLPFTYAHNGLEM